MSDVEALAYARAKLASVRGYFSRATYDSINTALNAVKGEMDSLKTRCGTLMADCEMSNARKAELEAENNMLREQLTSKSVAEVDSAVEKAVEKAIEENPCGDTVSTAVHSIECETAIP